MARFNIDRDGVAFVRAWQKSANVREVVERTGFSNQVARQIAVRLRRKGVRLRLFQNRNPDYKRLNRVAETA